MSKLEGKKLNNAVNKLGAAKMAVENALAKFDECKEPVMSHAVAVKSKEKSVVMETDGVKATVKFPETASVDAEKLEAIHKEHKEARKVIRKRIVFSLVPNAKIDALPAPIKLKLKAASVVKQGKPSLTVKLK